MQQRYRTKIGRDNSTKCSKIPSYAHAQQDPPLFLQSHVLGIAPAYLAHHRGQNLPIAHLADLRSAIALLG